MGIGNGLAGERFFRQPTEGLALALLGMVLVHEADEGMTAGRIVEVEMYKGPQDAAAHSYGGKMTARTQVMYGEPGHAYIYFIYGMHYCFNVVSGPLGSPEAILIRALEPVCGIALMAERRRRVVDSNHPKKVCALTNGPGKLSQAMGINAEQYGVALWDSAVRLYHAEDPLPPSAVARGPRINVGYAGAAAHYPWRFWIRQHPCLSVRSRD